MFQTRSPWLHSIMSIKRLLPIIDNIKYVLDLMTDFKPCTKRNVLNQPLFSRLFVSDFLFFGYSYYFRFCLLYGSIFCPWKLAFFVIFTIVFLLHWIEIEPSSRTITSNSWKRNQWRRDENSETKNYSLGKEEILSVIIHTTFLLIKHSFFSVFFNWNTLSQSYAKM